MFFPFTNFKVIDVPQSNSNGKIVYTTTARSMVFFLPRGSNMETDSPCGLYIEVMYTDTDGQNVDPWLFYSHDSGLRTGSGGSGGGSHDHAIPVGSNGARQGVGSYLNIPLVVPSSKNIRQFIGDSSDRLGGTLYIFELPQ